MINFKLALSHKKIIRLIVLGLIVTLSNSGFPVGGTKAWGMKFFQERSYSYKQLINQIQSYTNAEYSKFQNPGLKTTNSTAEGDPKTKLLEALNKHIKNIESEQIKKSSSLKSWIAGGLRIRKGSTALKNYKEAQEILMHSDAPTSLDENNAIKNIIETLEKEGDKYKYFSNKDIKKSLENAIYFNNGIIVKKGTQNARKILTEFYMQRQPSKLKATSSLKTGNNGRSPPKKQLSIKTSFQ